MNKHYVSHFITFACFILLPSYAPGWYRWFLAFMVVAHGIGLSVRYSRLRVLAGYRIPGRHLPLAWDIGLYIPSLYAAYCAGMLPLVCLGFIAFTDFQARAVSWRHAQSQDSATA